MRFKVALALALLVLGFIVYEFGIFMVQQPTSLLGGAARGFITLFSSEQSADLSATVKLAGGIMAILGLIMTINGVATSGERCARGLQALQASVRELESRINVLQTSGLVQLQIQQFSCKFCGAKIEKDELFCPVCGRAQK